jgi:hypothetical protein
MTIVLVKASYIAQFEGSIPSKVFPPVSWASVVFAPAASLASTVVSLQSTLEGKTEQLFCELLGMASTRLEEAV